jgi:hypothetical protein
MVIAGYSAREEARKIGNEAIDPANFGLSKLKFRNSRGVGR